MTLLSHSRAGKLLLGLLMLALASLPLAHRAGALPLDPQIARFLAAGGALEDICGDMAGHTEGTCESCRIVTPVTLSAAMLMLRPMLSPTLLRRDDTVRPAAPQRRAQVTPPARAPPQN